MTAIIYRQFSLDSRGVDTEKRTVKAILSTETPVERGEYSEVLPHTSDVVDLSRAIRGLPLIESHDQHKLNVGIVENVRLEGAAMVGDVRFGKSNRAQEIFDDVADGIVSGVSIGYIVRGWDADKKTGRWTAKNWMPFEVSAVSIPADPNAGFLRSIGAEGLAGSPAVEQVEAVESVEAPSQAAQEKATEADRSAETKPNEVIEMSEEIKEVQPDVPAVDVRAVADEARKGERARVSQISAIGEKFGKPELARQFVENGKTAGEFQRALLDSMESVKVETPKEITSESLGVSKKEQRDWSFLRLVRALAEPGNKKAQDDAGMELEISRAFGEARGRDARGAWVPDDLMHKRTDLLVGTAAQGGHTVATELQSQNFIDLLRNSAAVVRAGATVLSGLRDNVAIPAALTGSSVSWVAENSATSETNPTFRQVTLSPKAMGGYVDISRKLLLQSSMAGGVDNYVRNDLLRALALELDRVAIEGDPDTTATANEPRGIIQTTGIGSVVGGTNGAAPDRDDIVNLVTEVMKDNAGFGSLAFLMNSVTIGKLMRTKLDTGSGQFLMESRNGIHGFPVYESNNVPSDLAKGTVTDSASAIIFGDFSSLLIGLWSGQDILVNPYTGATAGTLRIHAYQDADVAVKYAQSFSAMLDAITT